MIKYLATDKRLSPGETGSSKGTGDPEMITTTDDTAEIEVLTEDEVEAAVAAILAEEGVTYDELRAQATAGRFDSESQRRAWFVIDGLVS